MREHPASHYVGLDIGTSMVRCVIGMVDPSDPTHPSVIGHGSAPNLGLRKGVIVHIEEVVDAVIQAITEAERLSGVQVHGATININGAHVSGMNSRGVIAISSANREITDDDRLRVEEAAAIVQLPPNREIIQVFAKNYRLDGQDNLKDPVGMHGVRLEVDTHIVTAATPNMKSLEGVLLRSRIKATNYTVSSLAAAEAVLNRQQKESGTLLLDIGAGTTNIVVIEDGEVQHVAVLPIGGINITNDLAIGLRTELEIAERVKIEHASLVPGKIAKSIKVTFNNVDYSFDSSDVQMIVEARVEELFELVDKELKKIHRSRKLPGGVVIVGGTSKLPGIATLAKEKLQLAARVGTLQSLGGLIDTVEDPSFSTAVGLMILDVLMLPSQGQRNRGQPNGNVFGLLNGALKRFRH
ncbi:MAG: cell division protein FtsA [Candidatus Saccharimonadales bacterium]